MVLATQPVGGAVTIVITSDDAMAVSRAPEALTFTLTDWQTAQTVTAMDDGNTTTGTARVDHIIRRATDPMGTTFLLPVEVTELEDTTPTLATVPNQTVQAGQRVNVRLPAATGERAGELRADGAGDGPAC